MHSDTSSIHFACIHFKLVLPVNVPNGSFARKCTDSNHKRKRCGVLETNELGINLEQDLGWRMAQQSHALFKT